MRWQEVSGERLTRPDRPDHEQAAGDTTVQIVRTVPEKVYTSVSRGDYRILESYLHCHSWLNRNRGILADLVEADAGNGRLLACTLYARQGPLADPVYVHAKVGIVDDE